VDRRDEASSYSAANSIPHRPLLPETVARASLFCAQSPFSNLVPRPQNVKLLPSAGNLITRPTWVVILLTHFFFFRFLVGTVVKFTLSPSRPRHRQLPESPRGASVRVRAKGASAQPNHPPAFRVARRRSQSGEAMLSLASWPSSFKPHVPAL